MPIIKMTNKIYIILRIYTTDTCNRYETFVSSATNKETAMRFAEQNFDETLLCFRPYTWNQRTYEIKAYEFNEQTQLFDKEIETTVLTAKNRIDNNQILKNFMMYS